MIYKISVILLTVVYLKNTQSVYLVNCPTNYNWNVQQSMCVQQSYCSGGMFGYSNQYCGLNYAPFVYQYYNLQNSYYNVFNHYSACQTAPCPCYQSTCQHIQTCYAQVPCYFWYIPKRENRSEPIISTSTIPPTTTTTIIPTTTTTKRTTTTTTTTEIPDMEITNGIDIKLINIINRHNHIHSPVYVNNTNIITSEVRVSRTQQENITLNGTSNNSNNNNNSNNTNNTTTKKSNKCCKIYSPKMCKLRYDDSWNCYHRKYKRCGSFCYRENIYLRPQQFQYRPPTLIMPPPRRNIEYYYNSYDYQSNIDCSGCIHGGYHCSSACYKYSCNTRRCGFIDQEYFCSNYGGHGCNEYDGYFN